MKNELVLADAGNTALKLAIFRNESPEEIHRIPYSALKQWLNEHRTLSSLSCVLASVTNQELEKELKSFFKETIIFDQHCQIPFTNNYQTPTTLGMDRICNAAALSILSKGKNAVSIDIGTCIKFDFVDSNGIYHGGSISPGIHLRYKALNDYTANLPHLNSVVSTDLIGDSTKSSIQSGVINGIKAEINGIIDRYESKYDDLTFFMTGGDAAFFDFDRKNNIFADENFTLKGLYYIYKSNVH